MDQPEVVSALSWLGWLELIKRIGGFMVIAGVAIEVGGDWISGPFHKTVEDARQLELSTLNNETARLSKEAEIARKETAQATLELQKLKNPRTIMPDELAAELKDKPKGKAGVLYVKECSDCEWLAGWLITGLQQSGWELINSSPMPLPPVAINSVISSPAAVAGGQPWNVSVVANTNAEGSVQSVLMWAMTKLLGHGGGGIDKALPDGVVRVIVGPRP
jgi:hypothetical protein